MEKIRIGLLIDDMLMPAWVQRMLEIVSTEEGVEISLVVRNAVARPHQSLVSKLRARDGALLYSTWRVLDRRFNRVTPDAFKLVDLSPLLSRVPTIHVLSEESGLSDRFSTMDIERIEKFEIDVILQLGFRKLSGEILEVASCGTWCYQPSANVYLTGSAGGWEVLLNQGTTNSSLQILTSDRSGGGTLYRSWSSTNAFSANKNLNSAYWKALLFVPRRLRDLRRIGRNAFIKRYVLPDANPSLSRDEIFETSARKGPAKLLCALFAKRFLEFIYQRHAMHQWILLYSIGQINTLPVALKNFKQLLPPRDRFWADPCVVVYQGKHVIFIEELRYENWKGFLSVIEFDEHGDPILPPVKILQKPYHLSYPFVFEDNDVLYMIPETMDNGTIELYQCVKFPDKWEFVMNLIENIRAVDATIWQHGGKYWMFANVVESAGASCNDELFLYYSDRLLSDHWEPHPGNPIVSDVRCARPAGRIFLHEGQWYRPSQDCSNRYGKAMSLQRIDRIDETVYHETAVARIDPDWDKDIVCVHTLSHMGQLTCIDGLRKRSRF